MEHDEKTMVALLGSDVSDCLMRLPASEIDIQTWRAIKKCVKLSNGAC